MLFQGFYRCAEPGVTIYTSTQRKMKYINIRNTPWSAPAMSANRCFKPGDNCCLPRTSTFTKTRSEEVGRKKIKKSYLCSSANSGK